MSDETVTRFGIYTYGRLFSDEECVRYRRLLDAFRAKNRGAPRTSDTFLSRLRRFADPELLALRLEMVGPEYDFDNFWSCDLADYLDRRLSAILLRMLDSGAVTLPKEA